MIHVIAVAYERVEPLEIMIRCFLVQTDPRWTLHIVHDGPASERLLSAVQPFVSGDRKDERIHFYQTVERYQKYGHPNRRSMLQNLDVNPNEFILLTNDDNYHIPRSVEFIRAEMRNRVGMIYWNTVHSHAGYDINYSEIRENQIDMAAFCVRADIAKATGFNHDHFSADGTYAEECLRNCVRKGLKAVKINKCLLVHN